ncbi:hypothetical protein BJF78_08075 [Pseudonocardia sp. CNS-139]|nr:hypothetical protein BJF78_08075 [Pseudonocardia sp. CNS-139]
MRLVVPPAVTVSVTTRPSRSRSQASSATGALSLVTVSRSGAPKPSYSQVRTREPSVSRTGRPVAGSRSTASAPAVTSSPDGS